MSLEVLKPGLLTSVQDLGRANHRALGVPVGGAVDTFSLQVANALVGNEPHAAALEITLLGPRLRFTQDAVIALCGGRFEANLDDLALPMWRAMRVAAGSIIDIGHSQRGARLYLAIAGGLNCPVILDSRATALDGGFGGWQGRALRAGDSLPLADCFSLGRHWPRQSIGLRLARWWANPAPALTLEPVADIGLLPGHHLPEGNETLFSTEFQVDSRSNRMGLRLDAETPLAVSNQPTLSEPVSIGTVQLPPEGKPIILLADAQTIGGYPRIGHIPSADHPRLAQLAPSDRLRFVPNTETIALQRLQQLDRHLQRLQDAARDALRD
ncbi:MAG: biotin-dependent carboxyltransferase family protein [Xanthomonadales bacterium]|nr:biotin-dependent carboxyltransferase family protein [Xanthomonadales bacterium]